MDDLIIKKEKKSAYHKKWKSENKEKMLEYDREYRKNNKERLSFNNKVYYKKHKEKRKETMLQNSIRSYQKHIERRREAARIYYANNKEIVKETQKKSKLKNIEKSKLVYKIWAKKNSEELNKKKMIHYHKNREAYIEKSKIYMKNRMKNDMLFKLRHKLGNRINNIFKVKSFRKNGTTETILGASLDIVKRHIENKFESWMNWDNHGEWEFDHIIPLSSAKTKQELIVLCHYTNIQPLLKIHNRKKSSKLNYVIPVTI